MIPLIYVAGPYRGIHPSDVDDNIVAARKLGKMICEVGAYPIIPHSNTGFFDGIQTDEFWLEATLEAMKRCDAVVLLPGWESSRGSRGERDTAIDRRIPVFYISDDDADAYSVTIGDLANWVDGWTAGKGSPCRG